MWSGKAHFFDNFFEKSIQNSWAFVFLSEVLGDSAIAKCQNCKL